MFSWSRTSPEVGTAVAGRASEKVAACFLLLFDDNFESWNEKVSISGKQ
jgi:hypothetical protein